MKLLCFQREIAGTVRAVGGPLNRPEPDTNTPSHQSRRPGPFAATIRTPHPETNAQKLASTHPRREFDPEAETLQQSQASSECGTDTAQRQNSNPPSGSGRDHTPTRTRPVPQPSQADYAEASQMIRRYPQDLRSSPRLIIIGPILQTKRAVLNEARGTQKRKAA